MDVVMSFALKRTVGKGRRRGEREILFGSEEKEQPRKDRFKKKKKKKEREREQEKCRCTLNVCLEQKKSRWWWCR